MNGPKLYRPNPMEGLVPLALDYWFRSPPGFIESMGVDLAKLPQEAQMKKNSLNDVDKMQSSSFSNGPL